MRRWLLRFAVGLVGLYALTCVLARVSYRRFVYPAPSHVAGAAGEGEALVLRASDGEAAHAVWFAPPPGARAIAYFHGNGETAEANLPLAFDLVRRGFGVLLVEYRGYGASSQGSPNEKGLYLDAEAALDEAARRGVGPDRVALWGTSLGTGVAAEMARRGRGSSLVLVAPFASLLDAASSRVAWLPMSLVVPDRFDTLGKAPGIHVPTLVAHGDRDDVIPFAQGRAVAGAIAGARFYVVSGAAHNDVYDRGGDALMDLITAYCARAG
jgi:pimeloyl-ACP methyl ester carboxylesterase